MSEREEYVGRQFTNKDKRRIDRTIQVTGQPNLMGQDIAVEVVTISGPAARKRWMRIATLKRKYVEVPDNARRS